MPSQHFKDGDEFDRLTQKRNMQLQRALDVRLQILQKEYRMTRERMDKMGRDCTEFLTTVRQKYPGLEVYSQPDTRAMSAQALAQVHAVAVAKEAKKEKIRTQRRQSQVVRPESMKTEQSKERAATALQRPKNAYKIVRRPLSAQQIEDAKVVRLSQDVSSHLATPRGGRPSSRPARTQAVIRIPTQNDAPVEARESRPCLANGSHPGSGDGGPHGRRQQAWVGQDDVFQPDASGHHLSGERQGHAERNSRPGTAQRSARSQSHHVNGVHGTQQVQNGHGHVRQTVMTQGNPQRRGMTPEATPTTIRPASSHPHARPRPSESSTCSRTGGILVQHKERPTMSAPPKRRVIFEDIIKALQECGVKHRQRQAPNKENGSEVKAPADQDKTETSGGKRGVIWAKLAAATGRKKSQGSETGSEGGHAKMLWKNLVEKVKTTEEIKKRPVSAPATYELYGRSPAVSRQQVAGIMAEIESRRASTRGLLQQSRDLQKYVKKIVGPDILREEEFSDKD